MKYIFDFDDVLFQNTKLFKKHMFNTIALYGVPEDIARTYYMTVRSKEFSLKDMLRDLFDRHNVKEPVENVYEKIMSESDKFVNALLVDKIKNLGKENCFIVTNGEQEFNNDKIAYSKIGNLFEKIYIVPGTKKDAIYEICEKFKDEKVFFTDDKMQFFEDIDLTRCPNLQTILYSA